jgi:hypothetical protein
VLAAMASGAWLLSDQYLTGCSKAHRLLEEVSPDRYCLTTVLWGYNGGENWSSEQCEKVEVSSPCPCFNFMQLRGLDVCPYS